MNILRMKQTAQRISRLLLLVLLVHSNFSLFVSAEPARSLKQIRLSSEANEIIASLELDGRPSQFTVYALTRPDRVVVDFQLVKYSSETDLTRLLNSSARQSGMQHITVQTSDDKVRVIFEASQKLAYSIERDANQIIIKFVKAPIEMVQPAVNKIQTPPAPAPSPKAQLTAIGRSTMASPEPLQEQPPLSTKKGKKSFAEGLKLEKRLQWELAHQSFLEALRAEPDNPEYRLHMRRAAQNAALQISRQGDWLISQKEFLAATQAYRQAYALDETNEEARNKFQQALLKINTPKDAESTVSESTVRVLSREERSLPVKDINQQIYFNNANLRQVIEMMANNMGLNVMFDDSFRDEQKFQLKLKDISMARALDQVLLQTKHTFEQTDRRTIMIYQDTLQNRQRIEQLMFKTFYLSNTDPNEARTVVQAVIGQHRQVLPIKNLNAIVVRDTFRNLQMVQALLDSIDKNRSEVVVDVDIYEVSRNTSLEIGNQLATTGIGISTTQTGANGQAVTTSKTSAGLSNLGGIGRAGIAALAGTAGAPVLGGIGTIIGLPPSTLSLLKSKSNSKLLASTQIHALDGEQNQTKVGRSVPVRIGSVVPGIAVVGQSNNNSGFTNNIDNIQYRDVGLIIDVTPSVSNEGYVQIKMKLESSSVEASALDVNLTPTFSQRSLSTIARVMDGKTAVVAGVKQESNGDTRASIPVIGMVPILGRLFSTPREQSSLSDIIITVTPHIIRSPNLQPQDFKARLGGNFLTGVSLSIEDILQTAQSEDDRERQIRGGSSLTASASPARINEPRAIPVSAPAGSNENSNVSGSMVNFSVTPNALSQTVGESFFAAVSISSQLQINEAQVALKYDPAMLELKSIQSGGLLGAQASIIPQGENGLLSFLIQQEKNNSASVEASGQLLLLEFTALKPGKSSIAFVNQQQIMKQGSPLPAQIQTQNAGIEIRGN